MKPEFLRVPSEALNFSRQWCVRSESDPLTDVLLCEPAYLRPVPCCSVTCESLVDGFETDTQAAIHQHRLLQRTLFRLGVRCHVIDAQPGLADLCFTRDTSIVTPWGPVLLNPALAHRQSEVRHVDSFLAKMGVRATHGILAGTIEGGDICIARDGLAIIGWSGERTSLAGAESLAAMFRQRGWQVLLCPFDAEHLHLDTIFCMLDERRALACLEALPDAFIAAIEALGIELLPVHWEECRKLGCNVLSIDGRTILVSEGQDRLHATLTAAGYEVISLDISQFAACGGGLHCLTMPLARAGRSG
jgi:N-dimethylarginine dimethylaminohydrolase